MGVELRPLGVKCNIQCKYCYQMPQRIAGNVSKEYSMEKMIAALDAQNQPFTLFGGEALLVPKQDLNILWEYGYKKFKKNSIQTNGVLIDQDHIELFKKYNVNVGISIDGPSELNDVRAAASLEKTRENTEKTNKNIEKLLSSGIKVSIITTLHRGNALPHLLPKMFEWMLNLERIGVKSLRLHILEIDDESIRKDFELSESENLNAFLNFYKFQKKLQTLKLDVFNNISNILNFNDKSITCIWAACDPYTTRAVRGIEGFGQKSNCGRVNKEGIDFVKSETEGFERYISLYFTPQEYNGCADCRFFLACKGQCPGTAVEGDWRNKTEHCGLWFSIFEEVEKEIVSNGAVPLSLHEKRSEIEAELLSSWSSGKNPTISSIKNKLGI